jgi:FkbM family methyltransferase
VANVFRAFPALLDRLGVEPRHLVHVGAHEGQEVPFYREAGIRRVTLVEPIPELAARLRVEHPDATVVEAACGSAERRAVLHVPRRSNMATLATPQKADGRTSRIEVQVVTLESVQAAAVPPPDMAVIDAQGRELDVLAGADLAALELVVVETCTVDDPTMASPYRDVATVMAGAGFVEAERWVRDYDWVARWARGRNQTGRHGEVRDVVFVKKEML